MISFTFDDYENFKFTNSLIGTIYACTPQGPDAGDSETKEDSEKTLIETLTTRSKVWYTYTEYNFASFLRYLCCCMRRYNCHKKRVTRQKLFVEGQNRLKKELSLHHLLSTMRLTDFIADFIGIKNYQKLLINKQRKY